MRCLRRVATLVLQGARYNPQTRREAATLGNDSNHACAASATLLPDCNADLKPKRCTVSPLFYSVPVLSPCTVGRHRLVLKLWQNVLAGCHWQLITGVDGIGKSTLAAEFCERVRQSGRFSCIQWFNAQYHLKSQLQHFFHNMQERSERDVLLVFDDVEEFDTVTRLVPAHKQVYIIMTSGSVTHRPPEANSLSAKAGDVMMSVEVTALGASDVGAFFDSALVSDVTGELSAVLGYVPLLLRLAAALLQSHATDAITLLSLLHGNHVAQSQTLSVSAALRVLVQLAVGDLARSFNDAARFLRIFACLHVDDLSDAVLHAVVGDVGGSAFAQAATRLGVLCVQLQNAAFSMHPAVARILRDEVQDGELHKAVSCLATLWPRRWRGSGMRVAYDVVWHTVMLQRSFEQHSIKLPPSLLVLMDRGATFLAHQERRDLAVAAAFWQGVHTETRGAPATPDSVRVARELGRLYHFLHDERAKPVLQWAYDGAGVVYGRRSTEAALILGCLALYWPASTERARVLQEAAQCLQDRLTMSDQISSKEELQMLKETIAVVLLRHEQMLQSLHQSVAPDIEQQLRRLTTELRGTAQTASEPHATSH